MIDKIDTDLTKMLNIKYPIIMAPMFLVSNAKMVIEANNAGITGTIPALNYRTDEDFRNALKEIRANCKGPIGINLIVNKSNFKLKQQLKTCLDMGVDYVITSLGSPEDVINAGKKQGMKVFADVVDEKYAKKVEDLGADALIAVNCLAGGHAGPMSPESLIPLLRKSCKLPVISAGGVGRGQDLKKMLELGACGVSIGSPFIASNEAPVSVEYKQACVNYGAKDIVLTTRLSGTPCTVINTPYVQEIGTEQSWFESFLNKNKRLKKFAKALTAYKGMKILEKAAFGVTYKTVWAAGQSIEYVNSIRPVKKIVEDLILQYEQRPEKQLKEILS
jgi:nitronate monooxygenase